jgi:hypothetical protein
MVIIQLPNFPTMFYPHCSAWLLGSWMMTILREKCQVFSEPSAGFLENEWSQAKARTENHQKLCHLCF